MAGRAGIRELRLYLSRYVDRVKAGETIEVTEHGRLVARLTPASDTASELRASFSPRTGPPSGSRPSWGWKLVVL